MSVVAARRVYGGGAYGVIAYGGLSPATVIPTRNTSGITFFTSNDRYQVVTCSYGGAIDAAPEFRYWYAAPPSWGEELNNDGYLPPYFAADEEDAVPVGSLETPYRRVKSPQEMLVEGVVVEFIPRPTSLTSDMVADAATCAFTVKVEGQGVTGYERPVSTNTSGIAVSDSQSFSEAVTTHDNLFWPNIRSEYFPCRVGTRLKAARVILTNIQLVEILAVQLIGKTSLPDRNA